MIGVSPPKSSSIAASIRAARPAAHGVCGNVIESEGDGVCVGSMSDSARDLCLGTTCGWLCDSARGLGLRCGSARIDGWVSMSSSAACASRSAVTRADASGLGSSTITAWARAAAGELRARLSGGGIVIAVSAADSGGGGGDFCHASAGRTFEGSRPGRVPEPSRVAGRAPEPSATGAGRAPELSRTSAVELSVGTCLAPEPSRDPSGGGGAAAARVVRGPDGSRARPIDSGRLWAPERSRVSGPRPPAIVDGATGSGFAARSPGVR